MQSLLLVVHRSVRSAQHRMTELSTDEGQMVIPLSMALANKEALVVAGEGPELP